ncbi:hypothetical protein ABZ619_39080 [Streptomyces sp. NPDC007851]|uniref:hypothetical protein n=1 Tax=Streptomyces sp. NPDC007851 TaxID=3155008 RepID=UPI0033D8EE32
MPAWYAAPTAALNVTLLAVVLIERLTPRTRCGLLALMAINSGIYSYLNQSWPWDALNLGAALLLIARWTAYPTKREREAKHQ